MRPMFELNGVRPDDEYGSGEYGSSRGKRTHIGTDFVASANEPVFSPIHGNVTKLGYPYGDDLSYRYVQVTDQEGNNVRVFYVEPEVKIGQLIGIGQKIGKVQTLQKRYPGIIDHVHLEVKTDGNHMSWAKYVNGRAK